MIRWMRFAIVVVVGVIFCGSSRGQTPSEKFAGQINAYKEAAAARKGDLDNLEALAQPLTDSGKKDMALITAYLNEEAESWNKAADALKAGDEKASAHLVKHAQDMQGKNSLWNDRLTARLHQVQVNEYLPANEESFDALVAGMQAADVKEVEAFMETKKRRSEAFGRLADATAPDANPALIFKLKDEVDACDVEVGIAELRMGWAREDLYARMYVVNDPTITSPQLSAALQSLATWRRKYEETYRQSRRFQHELEREKRAYDGIINERNESFSAARAEKKRAALGK